MRGKNGSQHIKKKTLTKEGEKKAKKEFLM